MKTQKTILAQAIEKALPSTLVEPTLVIDQFDITKHDIVEIIPVSANTPNHPTNETPTGGIQAYDKVVGIFFK